MDLNDSCYIILHRDNSIDRDRTRNLLAVLNHIQSAHNISILVLEQDSKPTHELRRELLNRNINYQFLYNPGLFNRSWGYNCGLNIVHQNKIILADNDIILNNNDLVEGLNYLNNYDIVKPFTKVYDLTSEDTINCIHDNKYQISNTSKERQHSIAGGLLMLTRGSFFLVGGYDERFEGWGGEDNEMYLNLFDYMVNEKLKIHTFGKEVIHLFHKRESDSYPVSNQEFYKKNCSYITDRKNRNKNIVIGQLNKYIKK